MVGVVEAVAAGGSASVRLPDGAVMQAEFGRLRAATMLAAVPCRMMRSRCGHRHLSGRYWCATTGAQAVCEPQLEPARLLLADFDAAVTGIAAQPFPLGRRGVV